MAPRDINLLITTFSGLQLPSTLSLSVPANLPIGAFSDLLSERLPPYAHNLLLSITTSKSINPFSAAPLSSLLRDDATSFLPLHLSARLPGGKGGFGSQLRAAGGRMSSRKNRNRDSADVNGSNRNLDGRRLRTITEAKNLAAYLAMKPDMDRKEKEERRKRWEAVVEAAERKEEEVREGKRGVRVDGEWVEMKEDAETRTREAVLAAVKAGLIGKEREVVGLERTGSESSVGDDGQESHSDKQTEASSSGSSDEDQKPAATRTFFGWDEDDEDMSDDEEDDGAQAASEPVAATYEGKGKGRA